MLEMKDQMFSIRGKKEVRDTKGNVHFNVANRLISLPAKTEILDAAGAPVCMLVSKVFSLHNTTYLCSGNSTDTKAPLLTAKKVILSLGPVLQVFLQGNVSDNPDITLTGSIIKHDFKITTSNGTLLAEVGRDLFTARDLLLHQQTYFVRILPNVDMALILALVVMADSIFVDQKGSGVHVGVSVGSHHSHRRRANDDDTPPTLSMWAKKTLVFATRSG
ncbi:unnamed protein product [Closterium sp. Naga37s-1]|nr:unnamed protein product [Closterium sp. Naga37s-1]